MATPFLGMINMFGQNWVPANYALAQGQTMPISQNQALYALFGTQFGGDGRTGFNLPDLRGRTPVGNGAGNFGFSYDVGNTTGFESVVLTNATMPTHRHVVEAMDTDADQVLTTPDRTFARIKAPVPSLSSSPGYVSAIANVSMSAEALPTAAGSGVAHNNTQPSIAINFSVALQGTFPPRS